MNEKDPVKSLKAAITERLHIDPKKTPLEVRLERDALAIDGTVDSIALKKRALLVAMETEGVGGVVDRLRVRPSMRMTDEEIKKHFYDAIDSEPTLSGLKLKTEVANGVIDIEGAVPSLTHKRLAGVLAWWIPGALDVINSLEVSPPEEDNDDEVKDAVMTAFEKDRFVESSSVTVGVRNWVVTLDGIVKSEAERDAAEEDAWFVWGVNDVKNNLVVQRLAAGTSSAHHPPKRYRPHRLPLKRQ